MGEFGVGQSVTRVEDLRFVTGRGNYVDDMHLAREHHACIVASPHAHARIVRIDTSAARAMPGVVCILTGKDVADLGTMGPNFMPDDFGGPKNFRTARPVLAQDAVKYAGERVAFVVAETAWQAQDAAEAIEIEYETLPAVVDMDHAVGGSAPAVWEGCADNTSFTITAGDQAATDAAFAGAAHVVSLRVKNNRVAATAIEPRAVIGEYRAADGTYTLYGGIQSPHTVREQLAQKIFRLPETRFRVVSPDVGGGFGSKSDVYPEDVLVLVASQLCGFPVRWVASRSDALLEGPHARDEIVDGELALDESGRILAMRARSLHGLGAYLSATAPVAALYTVRYTPGVYDIQTLWIAASGVYTNTAPTHVYRGPGRAEGNYLIERLLDKAAVQLGLGRDEIRRRNAVPPAAMPYATPTGSVYDSGEFVQLMDRCKSLADWEGYAARKAASEAKGRLRGRSVIFYIEHAGIFNDRMELRFDPSGAVTIISGLHSHGQGHATTFAQMVSEWLGVPFESIGFTQGDTDKVAFGRGTYAARSSLLGGVALHSASKTIIEKARVRAAELLGADIGSLDFAEGVFSSRGTNKNISLPDVAKSLFQPVHLDDKYGLGLEAVGTASADIPNYPNGCHVCEVEIEPDTGRTRIDRYAVVDDVGRAINPMICEGQIHGGLVQGIGQALYEEIVYDAQGQLLSGSLMDYCLPRADDLCDLATELAEFPSPTNPLGLKGVGESGTIGAPPAIVNAVLDALAPLGVASIDMPVTPQKVWQAIADARPREAAE